MHPSMTPEDITTIYEYDSEHRYRYFINEVIEHKQLWILCDDDGAVMLNTEDDDCVPVWPHKEFAAAWVSDEWINCYPKSIPLNQWHTRWTSGLIDDGLDIAIFPSQQEEGVVISPIELDDALKSKGK